MNHLEHFRNFSELKASTYKGKPLPKLANQQTFKDFISLLKNNVVRKDKEDKRLK
ncbi:MAG: hypothetical protein JWP69_2104 [Flaviaesturariibacter sp.]|nr:hypothetical protein [Flaviaesturariibacter sp.]